MSNNSMKMPANYVSINASEQQQVTGGGSFVSFIRYLLSNFTISFGSGTTHTNSDTTSTGTRTGSTAQSNVDNVTSKDYINWNADINLGSLFGALIRLLA